MLIRITTSIMIKMIITTILMVMHKSIIVLITMITITMITISVIVTQLTTNINNNNASDNKKKYDYNDYNNFIISKNYQLKTITEIIPTSILMMKLMIIIMRNEIIGNC